MSRKYSFALFFGICLVAFGSLMAWGEDLKGVVMQEGQPTMYLVDGRIPTHEEIVAWQTMKDEGFGPAIGVEMDGEYGKISTASSPITKIDRSRSIFTFLRYPESVTLEDDGSYLYVVYRVPSNASYAVYPPRQVPDDIYREVYGAEDGKIVYLGRQGARVTPEKVIDEVVEFPPWCPDGKCEEE